MKQIMKVCVLFIIPLMLSACGYSDSAMMAFEQAKKGNDALDSAITRLENTYDVTKKADNWSDIEASSVSANWDERIVEIKADDSKVDLNWETKIVPLMKKDDSDLEEAFKNELKLHFEEVSNISNKINQINKEIKIVSDIHENLDTYSSKYENELKQINKTVPHIVQLTDKIQSDFAARKDFYASIEEDFLNKEKDANLNNSEVSSELNKSSKDYFFLLKSFEFMEALNKEFMSGYEKYKTDIPSLYKSYSKILSDMKMECSIQLGQTTWNQSSDWNTDEDRLYGETSIPCESADYFYSILEKDLPLADTSDGGWGGPSVEVKSNLDPSTMKLAFPNYSEGQIIDFLTVNWPSSHSQGEVWINDVIYNPFHKYTIVENGKRTDTDWVAVDEETYDDHEYDLGMEILSKGYGEFEWEASDEAAPAGMNFVGNPQYGQWNGNSWSWFETYLFLSMFNGSEPHYYSRNEYTDWKNNYRKKEGYYGGDILKDKKTAKYGTYGSMTRKSTRMASSTFVKNGGYKKADTWLRTAGPTTRGGGPGGGGK